MQPPLSIEEYVQRLYAENESAPEDEEPPPPSPSRRRRGRQASFRGLIRRSRARRTRRRRWSTGRSSAAISPTRRTWLSRASVAK